MDKQGKLPSRIFQRAKFLLQSGPAREPRSGVAGGVLELGSRAVGTVPSAASARRSSPAFCPHLCQTAVLPEGARGGQRPSAQHARTPRGKGARGHARLVCRMGPKSPLAGWHAACERHSAPHTGST